MEGFLGRYESPITPRPITMGTGSGTGLTAIMNSSTSLRRALTIPSHDNDRFQISIGKLLLNLHRQDKTKFNVELESARSQVLHYIILFL